MAPAGWEGAGRRAQDDATTDAGSDAPRAFHAIAKAKASQSCEIFELWRLATIQRTGEPARGAQRRSRVGPYWFWAILGNDWRLERSGARKQL